jgi:hypothetical protein
MLALHGLQAKVLTSEDMKNTEQKAEKKP